MRKINLPTSGDAREKTPTQAELALLSIANSDEDSESVDLNVVINNLVNDVQLLLDVNEAIIAYLAHKNNQSVEETMSEIKEIVSKINSDGKSDVE